MKLTGNVEIDTSTAEWVVGSDEVGFGSWAGPLIICAAALPRTWSGTGLGDSKKLSEKQRRKAFERWTLETPALHHLVSVSPERIDELGVYEALILAHRKALETVLTKVQGTVLIVVDGFKDGTKRIGVPGSIGLPKADNLVPAVSLASILAKVTRDELMARAAKEYPGYGFSRNVGYGTPEHQEALAKLGPCALHRRSYAPIAKISAKLDDDYFEFGD